MEQRRDNIMKDIMKKFKKNGFKAFLSCFSFVALLTASAACFYFVLHDGGDDVKLPSHLQK